MLKILRNLPALGSHGHAIEPPGAVGGAHQWSGKNASESHLRTEVLELHELRWLDPSIDRVVQRRGAQILRDRE